MRIKPLLPFLLAFVLPLVGIFAWWGGFAPVDIRTETLGPYAYAYLEHTGDYGKLPKLQAQVLDALNRQGIAAGEAITVLYSNPDIVPKGERRARTGYLVPDGSHATAPLSMDRIAARPVLTARVRAGILLAPSRAYQALDDYLQARGRGIEMPTVEIYRAAETVYRMGELRVEMAAAGASPTARVDGGSP